jgi:magnesium chelatase family protein
MLPYDNVTEATETSTNVAVVGVKNIQQAVDYLKNGRVADQPKRSTLPEETTHPVYLSDIRGQETAKRGLLIAATGRHNIGFYGPPGTGKTMLARALISLLPPLTQEERFQTSAIHSFVGLTQNLIHHPPFRAPHHTSSYVSVIGGGQHIKPGEVTLAHNGVLFLDELPEFDRRVLESLREPLEEGVVRISRARGSEVFPANFLLVTSMNPCPCGYFGEDRCTCSAYSIERYRKKVSGPLLDRIDIWIEVPRIDYEKLRGNADTRDYGTTVKNARAIMQSRNSRVNSAIHSRDIIKISGANDTTLKTLDTASQKLGLSPRSYHKVLRVARTIADIENDENVEEKHIFEALQYRPKT